MGSLTIYAIKSSLTLALLYLPYTLLLRRDTSFRLNRAVLIGIVLAAFVVPLLNVPVWQISLATVFEPQEEALRQVTLPTLVVGAEPSLPAIGGEEHALLSGKGWGRSLVLLYILGMLVCLVWKAVGLVRLMRFIPRGCLWTDRTEEGITVYCHAGRVAPFSWVRCIVVGEQDSREDSPVMLHEMAHVRLHHAWDTLLVALAEALQWFNPCVWMLDASLREVHEYEADDAVLRRGISARDYQLLLIETAVGRSRYALVNAFNHSLLKNRITMMTKHRTSPWARLKVLYAVPLTLLTLGAFASQQFTQKVEKSIAPSTEQPKPVAQAAEEAKASGKKLIRLRPGTLRIVVDGKEMTEKEVIEAVQGKEIKNEVSVQPDGATELTVTTSAPDDQVVEKPEVMPEFPGGSRELWVWLGRSIKYPKEALEYGVTGRVLVEFIVEKDGTVGEPKIIHNADEGEKTIMVVGKYKAKDDSPEELRKEIESKGRLALEEEGLRTVKSMPRWKPGTVSGKPVRTKFVLPIEFKVGSPKEKSAQTEAQAEN